MADITRLYESMLGPDTIGPIRTSGESGFGRLIYVKHLRYHWNPSGSTPLDPGTGYWEGGYIGTDMEGSFPNPSRGPLGDPGSDPPSPWNPGGYSGGKSGDLWPWFPPSDPDKCPRIVEHPMPGPPYSEPSCTKEQADIIMQAIIAVQEHRWADRLRRIENGYLFQCILDACKHIFIECNSSLLQGVQLNPIGYDTGDGVVGEVQLKFNPSVLQYTSFLEAALVRAAVLMCGGSQLDAIALSEMNGIKWSDSGNPSYAKDPRIIRSGKNPNLFWGRYVWWDVFEGQIGILGNDPYDLRDVLNADENAEKSYNRRWYCPACVI